jgi:hypothetical protein
MPGAKDPTKALKKTVAAFPNVVEGTSCNQTSYKVGKKAFLYVGPGAKGKGYKAMFKLEASLEEAKALAECEPERFELGVGNWVTTRFSAEDPLPKKIWSSWLKESYAGAVKGGGTTKKGARRKNA